MTRHRIYARHSGVGVDSRLSIPLIKTCIREALRLEGVDTPCEVSVLIIDDRNIRDINREFRGIDKATDVLSFPFLELIPGSFQPPDNSLDPETGLLPLGDIVLSAERVDKQAREYGHSRERETAYLTVHSALHLLGYDHADESVEKKKMRGREDAILAEIGY